MPPASIGHVIVRLFCLHAIIEGNSQLGALLVSGSLFPETKERWMSQGAVLPFQTELCGPFLPLLDAIADGVPTSEVYQRALAFPQQATGADAAVLRVYELDHDCYHLAAQRGLSGLLAEELRCTPAGVGPWAEAACTGQPVVIDDLSGVPWPQGGLLLAEGFRGLIVIPLPLGSDLIGTLDLLNEKSRQWEPDRIESLSALSQGLVCLLHHARLADRGRAQAALAERSHLAQEIHDSSMQLLASLALWSEEGQAALDEGDVEGARRALAKVADVAHQLSAEFRGEVLELREQPKDGDFIGLLRDTLDGFKCQWGVETDFDVSCAQPLALGPQAESQLLRIVQESLANVRQHAHASRIAVTLERENGCVRLTIQDDGQGFDPREIPSGRFGLRIMRERARSIRGDVCVSSLPGEGTLVEISAPLEESVECPLC